MRAWHTYMLSVGFAIAASALCSEQIDTRDGITGNEMAVLLDRHFQDIGIDAAPKIAAARQFPSCDHIPTIKPRISGQLATVIVSCDMPSSWSRALRSKIALPKPARPAPRPRPAPVARAQEVPMPEVPAEYIVALAHSVARGQVLRHGDLILISTTAVVPTGSFGAIEPLIGRRLKQNLGRNRVIEARHLRVDWLVEKDAPVAIAYEGQTVTVMVPGVAQENGQLGDRIEVINRQSTKLIRGFVSGQNKITVRSKIY